MRSFIFLSLLLAAVVDGLLRKAFFGLRPGPAGAAWASRWCRRILRALAIESRVEGTLPRVGERGLAVVANHLSYLDILVFSAVQPFVMVSKQEVRRWPLIGWITAQAGTVYVQRNDGMTRGAYETHEEVNARMAEALASGLPVLFFPEGTTTTGETVLPFRRGLFHSVLQGRVPTQTAALVYALDATEKNVTVAEHICFVGDASFGPHLFRALGLRGLEVRVRFDPHAIAGEDRFQLASNARDAVVSLYEEIAGRRGIPRRISFASPPHEDGDTAAAET